MTRNRILGIAAVAALTSLQANAGEGFVGAGGGRADWPDDVCTNASACDRHAAGWYAKGGYMFLPWIGIEGRYVDLGRAKSEFAQPNITFESRYELRGPGVGAIMALPVGPDLSVNAVAGVMRQRLSIEQPDVTIQANGEGGVITAVGFRGSTTKTRPYYGVGVDMRIATNLSVGLDLTRYRLDGGADIDTLTGGVTYRFR